MTLIRGFHRGRFRLAATLLVMAVQLPAVACLCWLTGGPVPAVLALVISPPYLRRLDSPWNTPAPSLSTYLALGWWSACLVFDLLMGLAALAIWLGAPAGWTWALTGALALGIGADAVLGRPRLRRREVRIDGLPPELDGYRIGQLSDVHCGPNVPEHRVAAWVARLNALRLDLVTVTGDLITHGSSHVEAVARALGGLRARDGAFACMGNHDYFTDGEHMVRALERNGLQVLRNRGVVVEREGPGCTWRVSTTRGPRARTCAGRSRAGLRTCGRCCWRMTRTCFRRPRPGAWS